MRSALLGASVFVFSAVAISAQSSPTFDAASVKLSQGGGRFDGMHRENIQVSPGTVNMRNVTLRNAISWSYHVKDFQVTGPDWLNATRFDIVGKAAGPATEEELRAMAQALLAERFKVAFHRQTKEVSAYILSVGKGGPKFKESAAADGDMDVKPNQAKMSVTIQRAPMSQLIDLLANVFAAPVLDETGLTGKYDVTIDMGKYLGDMKRGDGGGGPAGAAGGGGGGGNADMMDPRAIILRGLQEELGLKLESKKAAVDLLIIDHAEKTPVEN